MKKILFLIPSLGGGGAERVLVNLVNNLDKTKYDVTIQTLFDVGINRKFLNPNVNYIGGIRKVIPANTKILKLLSPETLYCVIIRKKYDIVISYLEGPTARIVSGCPYEDTKLINWVHVEQHSIEEASYSYRSIKEAEACNEKFDKTICVAETVKEDFLLIYQVNHPCQVLYNTNESDKITIRAGENLEDFRFSRDINIISVGRLVKEKGYDRLLSAHKQLLENGVKHQIYVLGNGGEESVLRKRINDLRVADTFHLLGFLENPYKYVAKADLFVCSSRREGFSTAVTEALILGVPVVSTCCSGAKELLGENNEYGIVTENSEEGIYGGLYKMLTTEGLLAHYKAQAKFRGKVFSRENTVKAVEKMFDSLFEEES